MLAPTRRVTSSTHTAPTASTLRLPDKGSVCIPPHQRMVLLTDNTEQFWNMSVKDNLLFGHHNPKVSIIATISNACTT